MSLPDVWDKCLNYTNMIINLSKGKHMIQSEPSQLYIVQWSLYNVVFSHSANWHLGNGVIQRKGPAVQMNDYFN